MKAVIHSFESLAALDGEGLRCAVFLAGCPLRCIYCHNPDTWTMAGEEYDSETFVKKVSRYKPYFGAKGGVTFSGGEPLLQADFIAQTVPALNKEGIGYVIDTSGDVSLSDSVKYVLQGAQHVILDLKFPDDEGYRKYTGRGIKNTLDMLDFLESIGKKTWIRTVVIPKINDSEEEISKYLEVIKDKKCIEKYQLLAFHTMGFFKYERLGVENKLADTPPLDPSIKDRLQAFADRKIK